MVTVKSCGNMAVLTDNDCHMVEDEMDEDYKIFVENYYAPVNNVITDNNADGVDMVVVAGHNSDNDDNYSDPQYKMFLANLREKGKSYVLEDQLVHVRYEEEEEEEDQRLYNEFNSDISNEEEEDQRLYNELNSDISNMSKGFTGNTGTTGSDSRFDDMDEDYLIYLKSCRVIGDEFVFVESELEGSSPRQNSQVSDQIFGTPKEHDDTDEDDDTDEEYQLNINSAEEDITKEDKGEDGSNSTDSELIILENNQFCEGTPFVSSKKYHSSCFENERNSNESRALSAFDHSHFRKRLMEILEMPYDQEEYNLYMHEVHLQRQKERHRELRQGPKSCCVGGVNKSYFQLFPSLRKAIRQAREPHRVLFLLRGFFYWLENLTQEGSFQPWEDEPCLAILQNL